MELEEYFDFLAPDDIRIRGTRIGIESILYEYIHRSQSPEAIAERLHTVSLEQVYATILYYLRNRERLDTYLADWLEFIRTTREAQERNPPPIIVRLRQHKAQQQERVEVMRRWAALERPKAPPLPDEALHREQMYD